MSTPTETITYILYDDGTAERQIHTGAEPAALSKPGRVVTEAEYQDALDAVRSANEAAAADLQAQEQATIKGDYDALIAAGVPDATARRLTGHQG